VEAFIPIFAVRGFREVREVPDFPRIFDIRGVFTKNIYRSFPGFLSEGKLRYAIFSIDMGFLGWTFYRGGKGRVVSGELGTVRMWIFFEFHDLCFDLGVWFRR
jgi:hypothetical protein